MTRNRSLLSIGFLWACSAALVLPAAAQHFKQVTGTLTKVAAGRNEVFGIGTAHRIYRYNPATKAFVQIPGTLAQVAVGGGTLLQNDEIWGVGTSGQIYHFNFGTKTFGQVPGSLAQIVVGPSDPATTLGVGVIDKCHPYEVWGLNSADFIYRYNYCTNLFEGIAGQLTHIATGGGAVWGLNSSAQIFFFNNASGGFEQIPGSLQQIVVGVDDVFGLDGSGVFYAFTVTNTQFIAFGPEFTQIACGGDGLWGIELLGSTAHLSLLSNPTSQFTVYNTPHLVQIAAGSGAGVWGIDSSNRVYTFVRP